MTLGFTPAGFHVVDDAEWGCDFDATPPRRTVRLGPERREPGPDGGAGSPL
jgi:hypothetical protein